MPRIQNRILLILAVASLVSMGGYLLMSRIVYRIGFPLDDAWIHQTYARNLVETHQWAYVPGQTSAGSTAPLWTLMIAIGYLLHLNIYLWTYLLGAVGLWALSVTGEYGYRVLTHRLEDPVPWAGLFLIFEWHLVWSAGSGMETLAYSLLILVIMVGLLSGWDRWWVYGLLTGISVWIRPDGITLIGPIGFVALLTNSTWGKRVKALGTTFIFFLVGFIPYLLFNNALAGTLWPNTFYAKQAEYAILQGLPFITRYISELRLGLVGAGALLLPGALLVSIRAIREKSWGLIAVLLWWLIYLAIYAWRLPVTYQHGRYIIPTMPVLFILGIGGYSIARKWLQGNLWKRVIGNAWGFSIGLVLILFWGIGAVTYAKDVAIIETEMVDTAKWISTNTNPQDMVAAHDIGALGYYGGRPILDLAGLVSPEVIPFIRDENKLAQYIQSHHAAYLVVFPDWYPELIRSLQEVYTTHASFAPEQGNSNMSIYKIDK